MSQTIITVTIQNPTNELLSMIATATLAKNANNVDPRFGAVTPLNSDELDEFMAGVSDKTEALLRLFADHPAGEPSWSELMAHAGHGQWQQMRGFFAGITKRVRTVKKDNAANFYDLGSGPMRNDDVNGEWEDNPIFLHPTTLQSLRAYFAAKA